MTSSVWNRCRAGVPRKIARCCLLTALLLTVFVPLTGQAQEPTPAPLLLGEEPLRVGVYHEPPFAIAVDETTWDGLSVQLWREIADSMNLSFEFQQIPRDVVFEQVADGTVDLAIVGLATLPGEEVVDFSQTFYTSQVGIAERRDQTFFDVINAVLSPQFLSTALWVVLFVAIVGVLIWLLEGRHDEEVYGKRAHSGIWAGFWWAAVTMSTIGYGDIVPKSTAGRVLALVWMLVAMVITASLTATITTVLTLTSGFQPITFPEGLQDSNVGTVANSLSAQLLDEEGVSYRSFESAEVGLQALRDDEIDVFVDNLAALRYVRNQAIGPLQDLNLQETGRLPQSYAFVLAEESQLQEPVNRLILARINGSQWHDVVNRYVPEE